MSEFVWPVRVYYEDTDHGGVVYYANYLKFMERARTEWLRELGFEQDQLCDEENLLFAVRSVQLDYHRPAHFNDALEVSAEVLKHGRVTIDFQQQVRRGEEILCEGQVRLAAINAATLRPMAITEKLQQKLDGK